MSAGYTQNIVRFAHRLTLTPLPMPSAAMVALVLTAAGASYCVLHEIARDRTVAAIVSLAWATGALLPWYAAFEAGKRIIASARFAATVRGLLIAAGLAAACAGSILIGRLWDRVLALPYTPDFEHQLIARVPPLLIVAFFIAAAAAHRGWERQPDERRSAAPEQQPASDDFPCPIPGIDWIRAAGNYLEVHGLGRPVMVRLTMQRAEALLPPAAFVRVHRSIIVSRRAIERTEHTKDGLIVHMTDGTRHRAGPAFAARLLADGPASSGDPDAGAGQR